MTITLIPQSNQEAFDLVKAHLTRPGARQAVSTDGHCMYRVNEDPKGERCAAGALIPDEQYDPTIENEVFHKLVYSGEVVLPPDMSDDLIDSLQSVHDNPANWIYPGGIEESLTTVAHNFGLVP